MSNRIFGERVRQARKRSDMTMLELAGKVQISVAHLSDIERGHGESTHAAVLNDLVRLFPELAESEYMRSERRIEELEARISELEKIPERITELARLIDKLRQQLRHVIRGTEP